MARTETGIVKGIAVRSDTLYVAALLGRQLVQVRLTPDVALPLPSQP